MANRRCLLFFPAALFGFAVAGNAAWNPEAGGPFLRAFPPRVYAASPQNWAALQDSRGFMYFANTECVLEYDGINWRQIPVDNQAGVRSLAMDEKGTVYVGAQGEFGYLKADDAGSLRYVSLLNRVPAESRKFSAIWAIFPTPEGVYFGSYQAIFLLPRDGGTARVWKPRVQFGRLLKAGGSLYVTSEPDGLLQLRDGQFEPVPGGREFDPTTIRSMFATRHGLELFTQKGPIYRAEGTGFQKVSGASEGLLTSSGIYTAQLLDNDEIALATPRGGLVLLGSDGSVDRVLDKDSGLLSDSLTNIYKDREGALWITSNAGIERLDLSMTSFAAPQKLEGNVYSIARYDGRLYVGTAVGLFGMETKRGEAAHFKAVPGFSESIFALTASPHGLLAGGEHGVHTLDRGQEMMILKKAVFYDIGLSQSNPDRAWAVGRGGLYELLWSKGKWNVGRSLESKDKEFRSVIEDRDGKLWVGASGLIMHIAWNGKEPVTERFAAEQGIPPGFDNIYWWRGAPAFATSKGLLRFDGFKFVPASGLGEEANKPVSTIREAPGGATWLTGADYHDVIGSDGVRHMPLLRTDQSELFTLLPEVDGTLWAAGADGFLIRYEVPPGKSTPPFNVELRRVKPQNGPEFFEGGGQPAARLRLPYSDNSLRFEYAAPFFEDPAKVEYQVHLQGADSEWSNWSTEPHKDYTHLFEGAYGFEVRARNPHGQISPVRRFGFSIGPPWYRTWAAWLTYALLLGVGLWGLYRWRVRALVHEKEMLEATVAERTVEIRQQRDQIQVEQERSEALLLNILPASVASELKETGSVRPQNYDEVTVCFTDFVGFTLSSQEMPAAELVSTLHEYFTTFDEITEAYGLEKLKTIGDSYMLVSGLPRPTRGHAVNAVLAALRMVDAVNEHSRRHGGVGWGVRVGLNTGPVSAGVVGVRKFAYDIWGNTVNMASRMESSGAPGRVNLSKRTYELVRDFIQCEPRGWVQTKDKREQEMYFAIGVNPELKHPQAFADLYRRHFGEEPVVIPRLDTVVEFNAPSFSSIGN